MKMHIDWKRETMVEEDEVEEAEDKEEATPHSAQTP
jgi:hypothetical protein